MEQKNSISMQGFNLQLFDTDVQISTQDSLSAEIKEFYKTRLIDNAEPNLVHDQFGDEYDIPNGTGSTIEYRKFSALEKATEPLVEGVTKAGNKLSVSKITGEVHQYGDYIKSSDIIQMTAVDPIVVQKTKLLGSQAGRTLDTITREVLNSGFNVLYAPKEDGTEVTSRANLTDDCRLTPDVIFRCQAQLEAMNAELIQGSYVAIIHPYAAYDLMRYKEEWVNVMQYAKPENYFRGEIGMIGNVRFVKSSEAKIWTGDGCPTGKAVFSTLVLGAHAYAKTKLANGGLKHIVKPLGYNDELDRISSVGWKATKGADILSDEFIIRIESLSKYSATAKAN